MLTVGSLFSGIGGFDLGLERAGMRVIWQSEIDPYACAVLRKHWPYLQNLGDIRGINDGWVERPNVICGGFPCQPFSSAGIRRGKNDNRWLWPEMARVINELYPDWVICENVTHIDRMVLDEVLSDLERIGYEVAPTFEIPACAVGHDHKRSRIWIVGHANSNRKSSLPVNAETSRLSKIQADTERWRVALGRDTSRVGRKRKPISRDGDGIDADSPTRMGDINGIPNRLDRLRCLGNAVVPAIAEIIGRAIIAAMMLEAA